MSRVLFFGGLFSAVFVGVSFSPYEGVFERLLPWFALVPLIISLGRHAESARMRWLHGATFGWILCAWSLHPMVQADLGAVGGSDASVGAIFVVVVQNGARWIVLTALWGFFSWIAGPLIRCPIVTVPVLGLPVLWAGLEHLRTALFGGFAPWLLLGEAIDPGTSESLLAASFGVIGLGAAVVFANTAFALLLREPRATRQLLLAAIGCATVASCYFHGRARQTPHEDKVALTVAVVQKEPATARESLKLASDIVNARTHLVVFGKDAFLTTSHGHANLELLLSAFARQKNVNVLTGIGLVGDSTDRDGSLSASGLSDVLLSGVVYFTPEVGVAGRFGELPSPTGEEPDVPLFAAVLETDEAKIGVGLGEPFDSPHLTRLLVDGGAQVLMVLESEASTSGASFAEMRTRMHAYRAIENGVNVVRTTLGGMSSITDSLGRARERAIPGNDWATVSPVALRLADREPTPFGRWGWKFGPFCLGLSAGILAALGLLHRSRKGPSKPESPSSSVDASEKSVDSTTAAAQETESPS